MEHLDESFAVLRNPKSLALERPIGARPLAVPHHVLLEGDWLRWWTSESAQPLHAFPKGLPANERDRLLGKPIAVSPGRGMLENFVRLHRGSDEDIRSFAAKWGPLGICEHGRP